MSETPQPRDTSRPVHIAICAPAAPITRAEARQVTALAAEAFPQAHLHIHQQCFAEAGHFAGDDATRLAAFLDCANDPAMDAVWFARGGYGSNRIAAAAIAGLEAAARAKAFLGYSDMGYLLGGLYRAGIGRPAHGPMLADIRRGDHAGGGPGAGGGEAAVRRALGWLCGETTGLEPSLGADTGPAAAASAAASAAPAAAPAAAFNLMTLAMLCGTPLMPDLAGHVVMVEEVSEHLYAIDRLFFHVTTHLAGQGIAGLRLGRISDVPENDRPFGATPEEIARDWCARHGIAFLGAADIGHDAGNRIVPFGGRG